MTLNDNATLVIGAGNYFTATYSASSPVAMPANGATPGASYVNIGHTSLDSPLNLTSEGGDATTLGSLQNRTLRTVYSDRIDRFGVSLEQFDSASLKLYYGSNSTVDTNGNVQVPVQGIPTIVTFLAVFFDGTKSFSFYAPKAEIFRSDDLAVQDTQSLAALPLSIKPLQQGTNTWTYAVTPLS